MPCTSRRAEGRRAMKDEGSPQSAVREMTLRAISDDYENFEKIVEDVSNWCADRQLEAGRPAIKEALETLIKDSYAQAYLLTPDPPANAEAVKYSEAKLDDLWFYVTAKGKNLALSLRKKWRA